MAGPGGGRSGGGFGGGSRGGGFGGGGFGGGRPKRYYGGYYRPRPFFYGGGCLGGLMGFFLAPIIMIVLAVSILIGSLGTVFSNIANGGAVVYDEMKFQDYANEEYYSHFDGAYEESGILVVFLTNEACDDFYCIAWVGDNVKSSINEMFGNQNTAFGKAILSSVNESNYKYSLDSNLAMATEKMNTAVSALGLESPFVREPAENSPRPESKLVNDSSLELTDATVNTALAAFSQETGLPMVITVDEMESVFGKTVFTSEFLMSLLAIGLIALAIFLIVRNALAARKQKKAKESNPFNSGNMFDDGNPFR